MDDFELISAIWEVLAKSNTAQGVDYMMRETGAEPVPVRAALVKLQQAKLVDVVVTGQPRLYRARLILSALEWAQALSLGVSIVVLETYGQLQVRDRQQALKLASDGAVERYEAALLEERREARNQVRINRAKSRAAATELGQLAADARRTFNDQKATGKQDPVTLFLLEQLAKESESSLAVLEKSLLRG